MNLTSAANTSSGPWNNTDASSTVVTLGNFAETNASGDNFVMYCFAPVEGFSAFGSYTGNGSTDGPFVYTGFRPAWVMVKRSDGVSNWHIIDTTRSSFNVSNANLFANLSNAESVGGNEDMDILSNGFKPRNASASFNISSATYIYAAFAENPFKNSLAR